MFIVKVRVRGESRWVSNGGMKFDTPAEAMEWMRRLASRWTLVEEWAIEEAS
jgi:hypothetical protein